MTIIRPATRHDLFPIAGLIEQNAGWVKSMSARLKKGKRTAIYVAEQAGDTVGFSIVRIVHGGRRTADGWLKTMARRRLHIYYSEPDAIIQPTPNGFIENIFIAPALRRQGIATALVQDSWRWLQRRSVNELQTTVMSNDTAAGSFFGKLGFEPIRVLVRKRLVPHYPDPTIIRGIRPALGRDLPRLVELVRREIEHQQQLANCFQLIPQVNWSKFVTGKMRRRDTAILVAEKSGHLAGYIEIRISGDKKSGRLREVMRTANRLFRKNPEKTAVQTRRTGFIEDIYIEPGMRNRAIGSKLLKSSLSWFMKQGIHEIQGAIWLANKTSQNFFQEHDFEPVKLMMRKRL